LDRSRVALVVVVGGLLAAAVVAIAMPITRAPAFHHYADQRAWLGIPHAGDVLSNLPFVIAGVWFLLRAQTAYAKLACLGVAAIGIGSGAYHIEPSDVTLAFDWGPIAIALMLVTAAVIEDRLGERAGKLAVIVGPLLAIASVVVWIAGGGTGGMTSESSRAISGAATVTSYGAMQAISSAGTVTPYGAVQALGVALPALLALIAPGSIPRRPLLLAVLCFALARLCAANDMQLLDAIGISGHSLKHIAAAIAAAFGLHALTARATSPASRAALSSS
jgi:hypothetical protein